MSRFKNRRNAMTLTEVLVAMGILAVGMLSLMALFPIGATNMVQAIQDDRASQAVDNADAVGRIQWKLAYLSDNGNSNGLIRDDASAISNEPLLISALDNDGATTIPPTSTGPSFPVLVDPIGYIYQPVATRNNVAGLAPFPRRTFRLVAGLPAGLQPTAAIRLSTVLDDFTFNAAGLADASTGAIDRGGRYNVAWLYQRPNNSIRHEVNLTVLVFAGRPVSDVPAKETASGAITVNPGETNVSCVFPLGPNAKRPPGLTKGRPIALVGRADVPGTVNPVADFYRVVNITELPTPGAFSFELDRPIRAAAGPGAPYNVQVVVFEHLYEAIDRGIISAVSPAAQ
jgi:prepilin-type N-terminal cleavage/methylation domain-containing protein